MMKKLIIFTASLICFFSSCNNVSEEMIPVDHQQLVDVTVSLCFTYSEKPLITRATTGVSATETPITRISFKVFDAQGNAYGDPILQLKGDTDFGQVSCSLPLGTYTFVAVAHSVSAVDVASATISSPTSVTLPERPRGFVYSKTQSVTISDNTPATVTMDMGYPINADLKLKINDKVPFDKDIKKLQFIYNSQLTSELTSFVFNPATGCLTTDGSITIDIPLTEGANYATQIALLLPTEQHTANIILRAIDSNGDIVVSKTASDVSFHQAYMTQLTGTLFTSDVTTSFTFITDYAGTIEANF